MMTRDIDDVPGKRLPAHVHADARWVQGGIGRFSREVLPRAVSGLMITGRRAPNRPSGALEMAVKFGLIGARSGILYSPGFVPPLGLERRAVVTVHDLHYLDPAISDPVRARYFRHVIVPRLWRCRLVLTVSEHSAHEIIDVLGSGGPNVVVVGCGVDAAFLAAQPSSTRDIPRLLFVGGDKANKNLAAAMRAVAMVGRHQPLELIVVGHVRAELRACAPPEVSFIGTVDDATLAKLYASSTALLMPSLAEGFGLPALESLVAGRPVVFGNRAALPGVVGEWGWPVDPTDDESIVAGIDAAISSPIVVPIDRRRAIADQYRWDEVARRVVAAARTVL